MITIKDKTDTAMCHNCGIATFILPDEKDPHVVVSMLAISIGNQQHTSTTMLCEPCARQLVEAITEQLAKRA